MLAVRSEAGAAGPPPAEQRPLAFRAMAALSDLERRLVETAVAGETLDLRAAAERELRAGVVRDVLLGEHGPVDARGLQVRGAALLGTLDLDGMQTRFGSGCATARCPASSCAARRCRCSTSAAARSAACWPTTPWSTARCCSGAGSPATGW